MDLTPAPRRRRWVWPVVGVVVLAATAAGLLVARNGQANGDKKKDKKDAIAAAPVELSTVGKGSISTFLETTTVLEPENTATLVARRQGQVVALLADEGQAVSRGQVLARLDDTEARIALSRARLPLEPAERDPTPGQAPPRRGVPAPAPPDRLTVKPPTPKRPRPPRGPRLRRGRRRKGSRPLPPMFPPPAARAVLWCISCSTAAALPRAIIPPPPGWPGLFDWILLSRSSASDRASAPPPERPARFAIKRTPVSDRALAE